MHIRMAEKEKSRKRISLDMLRKSKIHLTLPSRKGMLVASCLVLTVIAAVLLRIQPAKWGSTLSEFDPFFQYESTQYIVDHGFTSFVDYVNYREWYPSGRHVGLTSFPGLPFAGAALYMIVRALGITASVMDVAIVFPVFAAALTCIVMYFLGKEVGGEGLGLVSAFLLAVSPAYIERTGLGFYDDETLGILFILVTFLFYLRAMKRERAWFSTVMYSALAGLSLGYVFASWGAARYPLSLLALFTFCLILVKQTNSRLLISYGVMNVVGLSIGVLIPKLGFGFVKEFEVMAALGVLFLLFLDYASKRLPEGVLRKNFIPISVLGLTVVGLALWVGGIVSLPGVKFISVLNPFFRSDIPLLASVQEHRPSTWAAYYYQFGQLVFFVPLGLVFALRRITPQKIFVVCYAVTTLYFSATLSRLTILAAPALILLGTIGLVEIIRPFSNIALQRTQTRRRIRVPLRIGRGFSFLLIVTLFALTFLPLGRGIDAAYSPTTIASSTLPIRAQVSDWMEALQWMKLNLPKDAVVASWWDYGYWISIVGGKISLADNGTINSTQIAQIGRMFMSNENESVRILKQYDSEYVAVFTTINQGEFGQLLFGDEVKWRWMAKIGWDNNTADVPLEDTSITTALSYEWATLHDDAGLQQWYSQFATYALPSANTTLTKMIVYGSFPGWDVSLALEPQNFELVYSSSRRLVFIYKVKG